MPGDAFAPPVQLGPGHRERTGRVLSGLPAGQERRVVAVWAADAAELDRPFEGVLLDGGPTCCFVVRPGPRRAHNLFFEREVEKAAAEDRAAEAAEAARQRASMLQTERADPGHSDSPPPNNPRAVLPDRAVRCVSQRARSG